MRKLKAVLFTAAVVVMTVAPAVEAKAADIFWWIRKVIDAG